MANASEAQKATAIQAHGLERPAIIVRAIIQKLPLNARSTNVLVCDEAETKET